MHNARSLIAFKMCAPWKLSQTQIVEKRIKRRVGNLCIFVSLQTCFVDFISLLGMTEMLLYSCDSNNLRIICCFQSRMFLLGCFLFPLYLSGYASLSWPAEVQASTWLLPLKESELFISNWMENYFHETQLFLLNSQTQFTNQFSSIISPQFGLISILRNPPLI